VLFAHEKAFADRDRVASECERLFPDVQLVEVPASEVPVADAVSSYLFNAQLVSPPDGETTLIVPSEARETASVWSWLQRHVAGNGPIRNLVVVDVRQSLANGGGPACLRLRVAADPATVDPRFLVDEAKLDRIAAVIEQSWPAEIHSSELQDPKVVAAIESARASLYDSLDLAELI
jgi:succinylarginine dihydrolase